ncbi:hypothetical protein DB88DRAFT_158656 [Papiliotrema laurentii]|uniref:Uncharacterized protein n=1 Tax=Papiliotrema laurentii TaxID=5418 RepID=A0AAD9L8I4_PAPLA|nr:hypothetical protein DB88DRAFT_158656 [Papiliotrema laurentii]
MVASTKSAPAHCDMSTLLRPDEVLSVSLPCRVRTEGPAFHRSEAAIVRSRKEGGAAVMVVVPSTATSDVRITHLIPITQDFKHSLNQTPPSPSTSFFHQSSRPHITLSLWDAEQKAELRVSGSLTARVQAMISELRRLTANAHKADSLSLLPLAWTHFYPTQPPSSNPGDWSDDEEPVTPATDASTTALSASTS